MGTVLQDPAASNCRFQFICFWEMVDHARYFHLETSRALPKLINLLWIVSRTLLLVICCHISGLHGLKRLTGRGHCQTAAPYADSYRAPL